MCVCMCVCVCVSHVAAVVGGVSAAPVSRLVAVVVVVVSHTHTHTHSHTHIFPSFRRCVVSFRSGWVSRCQHRLLDPFIIMFQPYANITLLFRAVRSYFFGRTRRDRDGGCDQLQLISVLYQ